MVKAGRNGSPIPDSAYVLVQSNPIPNKASEVALCKEVLNCFFIPVAKLTDVGANPSFSLDVIPGGDFVFDS
jgi:hypothetical protein